MSNFTRSTRIKLISNVRKVKMAIILLLTTLITTRSMAQPAITSLSSQSGVATATITITGNNFNSTASDNIVYFGVVKAPVVSASTTSLKVTVPAGATYQFVSVTDVTTNLSGYSMSAFMPTYDNSTFAPGTVNFDGTVDIGTNENPRSICIGDMDGDGKPDLVYITNTASTSTVTVCRNNISGAITAGSFTKTNIAMTYETNFITLGDIDGDGKLDIITSSNASNKYTVLRNTTTGTTVSFAAETVFSIAESPKTISVCDLDKDGKLDIFAPAGTLTLYAFRNVTTGTTINFNSGGSTQTGVYPYKAVVGELTTDNKPDIYLTHSGGTNTRILTNSATPGSLDINTFAGGSHGTNNTPLGIAVGDLSGDGRVDIVAANFVSNDLSVNTHVNSNFGNYIGHKELATGTSPVDVAISDIDGDGWPDIIATNSGDATISVFRNLGLGGTLTSGSFTKSVFATGSGPQELAVGDLDGDGKPEIVTANATANTLSILHNNPLLKISGPALLCTATNTTLSENITGGAWSSSNSSVATIDGNGKVFAIAQGTANISYTISGGSAVLAISVKEGQPAVTSVSPQIGYPASAVTITGSGFNIIADSNIVYFGATRATVTTASASVLNVTVPASATYQPVTVNNLECALTGYSSAYFLPTYDGSVYAQNSINMDTTQHFVVDSNVNNIAIGDLDGDGKPDIVVTHMDSRKISVCRNISTSGSITPGSFAPKVDFVVDTGATAVTIGDIDGDGKPEIVTANYINNSLSILHNVCVPGPFTPTSFDTHVDLNVPFAGPIDVAVADIDSDGRSEVVLLLAAASKLVIFHNIGSRGTITTASFEAPVYFTTGSNPDGVRIGDFDADGKPDIAVCNNGDNTVSVFRNKASSRSVTTASLAAPVVLAVGSSPQAIAVGDIDGDGRLDIATSNLLSNTVSILRNTGSSAIAFDAHTDFTTNNRPNDIDIADMNGDGKPDLIVTCQQIATISVYRNTSVGSTVSFAPKADFTFTFNASPGKIAVCDLDGDGKPDIATGNGTAKSFSVFRNDPLAPITGAGPVCTGATITLANYNTDGTWSSRNNSIASVTASGVVRGNSAGVTVITYTKQSGFVTTSVTVNATPMAIIGNAPLCTSGSTIRLSDASANGTWSSSNTLVASVGTTGGTVTAGIQGTAIISYNTGCGSATSITATVSAAPIVNASPDIALYTGYSAILTAGGADTYTWSPPTGLSSTSGASVTAAPATTTIYTVTGTNICGSRNAKVTVAVYALPTLSSSTACTGSTLTIAGDAQPTQIVWQQEGVSVDTVTTRWAANAVTVAGGNGDGSLPNQLSYPYGIFVDGSGSSYVADRANNRIQKWSPGAAVGVTVAGGNGAGSAANQFNIPEDVFVDGSGNIYVTDFVNSRVQKWAPGATEGITVAGGNGQGSAADQLDGPSGVCVDSTGNIYIADFSNSRVQKWAPGAMAGITVAGGNGYGNAANQLSYPIAVVVDASGNIYVADYNNSRVQKWATAATEGVTVAGGNGLGSAPNQVSNPNDIYVDGNGNIYVVEDNNNRIQKWAPGAIAGITVAGGNGAGNAADQLNNPVSIYLDDSANIYVSDFLNHRIQKFSASITNTLTATGAGNYSAVVTTIAGTVATNTVTIDTIPMAISGNAPMCVAGAAITLSDIASPHGTWSSSNTLVASVSNTGVVTPGNTAGTTTISYATGCGMPAIITVSVNATPVAISGNAQMCVSGTTITLSDNSSPNGTWSSSNTSVTEVNAATGIVTPGSLQGIATITYSNGCGPAATITTTVNAAPAPIDNNAWLCAGGGHAYTYGQRYQRYMDKQ